MKKLTYGLFILSIVFLLVSVIAILYLNFPIKVYEYYTSVEVSNEGFGFDLNDSALTFGRVNLGGSSTRSIVFRNEDNFPVIVEIVVYGNISEFISFEESWFFEVNESKSIGFSVFASEESELGFYDGKVYFKVRPVY